VTRLAPMMRPTLLTIRRGREVAALEQVDHVFDQERVVRVVGEVAGEMGLRSRASRYTQRLLKQYADLTRENRTSERSKATLTLQLPLDNLLGGD
jgi:hypothetical protein